MNQQLVYVDWQEKDNWGEVVSFESVKREFLWAYDDFVQAIYNQIVGDLKSRDFKDYILFNIGEFDSRIRGVLYEYWIDKVCETFPEVRNLLKFYWYIPTKEVLSLIEDFIQKYWEIFNWDMFRNINDRRWYFSASWSDFDSEVKRLLKVVSHSCALYKTRINQTHSEFDKYSNECAGDLQRLVRWNKNIPWYIVLKLLWTRLRESKSFHEFFYYLQTFQNSTLFKWTPLENLLNNFLSKYSLSFVPLDQIKWLLDSDFKWEEILESILSSNWIDKQKQFEICLYIMVYHQERYESFLPRVFEVCMRWLCERRFLNWLISSEPDPVYLEYIGKLYEYYLKNKDKISKDMDVIGTFDFYLDLYTDDDFEHKGLEQIHLPLSYVRFWYRWLIRDLISSLKLQKKTRIQNEYSIRKTNNANLDENRKRSLQTWKNPINSLPDISSVIEIILENWRFWELFEWDFCTWEIDQYYESLDQELWKEYIELKKMKPKKWSNEAERIKEIRQSLKAITDPSALRQRVYSEITSDLYWWNDKKQRWSSIKEDLDKKRNEAFHEKREKQYKLIEYKKRLFILIVSYYYMLVWINIPNLDDVKEIKNEQLKPDYDLDDDDIPF